MADHVCPWWMGYVLASPLRKLAHNPETILKPHVRPGMRLLDVGCAMGFYSLPMARLAGPAGRVVCVDLQERMLVSLERRARKAGLLDRIEMRVCGVDSLNLNDVTEPFDFALLFAVAHEVPDPPSLFGELHAALRPGGTILFAEPKGPVSRSAFDRSLSAAQEKGFQTADGSSIWRCRSAILRRP